MIPKKEKKNLIRFIISKVVLYTSKDYINFRLRSIRWFFVKRGAKTIDYQYNDKIKLKLFTDRELSRLIYCNQFEKDEFQFMDKYVKNGTVVYDIGANIGLHSLYLSTVIGDSGVCYAFEPVKSTYDSLNENVLLNGFKNIVSYNVALSDKEETLEMYKSKNGYDAWNSLGGFQKIGNNQYELEKVVCIPLDSFLEKNPDVKKPDFLKIDTEGWEMNVLKGAHNFLKDNSPVLMMEYAQRNLNLTNTRQSDLHDYLTSLGYNLYQYDYKNDRFLPVNRDDIYDYINIIATKSKL